MENIQNIFSEYAYISGKKIMLKVDSGPSRSNKEFLDCCRSRGIIFYPGAPNTTSVSKDMDQSYRAFKTGFYASLASLVEYRLKTDNGSGHLQMSVSEYEMLIFGGKEGTF